MSIKPVVYFAHGKESGPTGTKILALSGIAINKGFQVESPDYSGIPNPELRIQKLISTVPQNQERLILVGSSMGAYVSAAASQVLRPEGLFLMAPAFYIPEYQRQNPKPFAEQSVVVHGWRDEIVPVENSIRYAKEFRVPLYILDSDHQLTSALPVLQQLFEIFLDQFLWR